MPTNQMRNNEGGLGVPGGLESRNQNVKTQVTIGETGECCNTRLVVTLSV